MQNLFIEGIPGSGKSTLLRELKKKLVDYHVFSEGDISPLELAWCSYMNKAEYQKVLLDFSGLDAEIRKNTKAEGSYYITAYTRILADRRDFYQQMEQYEIYNGRRSFDKFKEIIFSRYQNFEGVGNLFECSFFQNIIQELMLFYCKSEEEILSFYEELFSITRHKNMKLLYLYSNDVEGDILRIKKERCDVNGEEIWFPLMMNYLNDSPYGKEHRFQGMKDVTAHFERRIDLEMKIIDQILGSYAEVLQAKAYDIEVEKMIWQSY